jgi:hypothetical protein
MQHSPKHMSRSERADAGLVMNVSGMGTSTSLNHRMLVAQTGPTKMFPYQHPWLLG